MSSGSAAAQYVFDFGDGTPPVSDADGVIEHTYLADGQYLSRVRLSDASSAKALASISQPVVVGSLVPAKVGADRMGGALGLSLLTLLAGLGLARRRFA